MTLAGLVLGLAIAVVSVRAIESWPVLITGLMIVIFLIPIKRYKLPGNLPFDIEPYRLMVLGLTMIWVVALLVDHRVRLRRTMLDAPMIVLLLAVMASVSANTGFIYGLGVTTDVVKAVSFFASFLLVYFTIVTVLTERRHIERLIRVIVVLAAVVSFSGVIEFRTGFNVFNHLSKVVPILNYEGDLDLASLTRSDRLRVYASAQHPIALAGALAMILPLSLYLAQTTRRRIWWFAVFLVGLGALSTLSRTGVVALIVAGVTLLVVRPVDTRKLLPLLAPAMVVVFFVLPNALGTFKSAFFPQGGIVAEQSGVVYGNQLRSTGRLSDIGPVAAAVAQASRLRAGLRLPDRGAGAAAECGRPRRPVARDAARDRPPRGARIRLGGRSSGPAARAHGARRPILARAPGGIARRVDHVVCRVDGHVRRVRVHPGDAALVRSVRNRLGGGGAGGA